MKLRFLLEFAGATVSGCLAILTLAMHSWIEVALGIDPDGGNGVVELAVVTALAAACIASSLRALAGWRRLHLLAEGS